RSQTDRYLDAGRTRQVFEVQIRGDTVPEADETFTVTLSNVAGALLGNGVAVGTIFNDDGATLRGAFKNPGQSRLLPPRKPSPTATRKSRL
ncbi:MAG: hypothetical protein ABIP44_10625, partial [Pseudoxanthomonas sp.]